MAFNHGVKKSSSGLWHLLPTLKIPFLRATWAIPANKQTPSPIIPLGFFVLCCPVVMSILCLHLVSVCSFFPGLVSGMRRRKKKNSQSRSPIQRRRERTMPSVRARTGTEGWTHLGSYQKSGAPSSWSVWCHHCSWSPVLTVSQGQSSCPCAQDTEGPPLSKYLNTP